ncbi:MAG: molybdenum-dependent transcriptional regulator [Burkholderiales bacterium PBB6]|nr:MAG: molybdenum-dependent transcriptional regulator [Burkholderiales bacterium PBB6]
MTERRRPPTAAKAAATTPLTGHFALQGPQGSLLDDTRMRLLEAIDAHGSLNRAAAHVPMSYKAAWEMLNTMSSLSDTPLVERLTGGAGGGGTRLTAHARQLMALYRAMASSQQDVLNRLGTLPPDSTPEALRSHLRRLTMRSSARNQFAATVLQLVDRGGMVDVQLDLGADGPLLASVTPEAVHEMGLAPGQTLFALIKAPWVQVRATKPRAAAHLTRWQGTLQACRPGSAHVGVTLALPGGGLLHGLWHGLWYAGPGEGQLPEPGTPVWASVASDSVVLVSFS